MPENIGPKIGIDGYADFTRSMNNIIAQSKELSSEFKLVTSQFDKNDQSQEKLAAQMQVLGKQIDVQTKRVELLGTKYQESEKHTEELRKELQKAAAEFGETSKEAQKAQAALDRQETTASKARTEYNNARTALNKMNGELSDLKKQADGASTSVDDVADSIRDAADEAQGADFGDILGAGAIIEGAKAAVDAIGSVIDEATEYRKIMGTLNVSSEAAGYSAEQTSETYYQLYWALGDTQAAATATANLQALQLSQEDLNELLELSVGAWATYGDSIPIDSLAESINETIRSGTVTGAFADVLNWGAKEGETFGVMLKENTEANKEWNTAVADAKTAEDYFNLALQDAGSQAERTNLVMQAMASQGLADTADAWYQNNEDIVEANNAQLEFTENAAQLSERIAPVMNAVKSGFNDIFEAILQATEGIDFNAIAGQIQGFFDAAAAGISFVIENRDYFVTALAAIAGGFAALKLASLAGDLKGVISGAKLLSETFPLLSNAIGVLTNPVFLVGAAVVGLVALIATKGDEIQAILQKVDDFLQNIFAINWQEIFGPVLGGYLNGFFDKVKNIWDAIKRVFDGVIDFIRGVFTGDWERAWQGVQDIFGGIFDGLVALVKAPINAIISLLNGLIGAVNWVIGKINIISFRNPFTGEHFGINLPSIPDIPYLATGGVVRRGSAIVGEAGPELMTVLGNRTIVQPLPASYAQPAGKIGGARQSEINITINAAPGMDENALANAVAYKLQSMAKRKEAVW